MSTSQHLLVRFTLRHVAVATLVLLAARATPATAAATDAILSIEGTQAAPGSTISIVVDLANQADVRGLQFTLSSDPPVVLAECGTSSPCTVAHAANRSQGFSVDAAEQADGTIRVLLFSLSGGAIAQGSGVVLTLDIMVPSTTTGTAITLTPTDVRVGGVAGEPLTTATKTGQIVLEPLPPAAGSGGGGGGGCALSEAPAKRGVHSWLVVTLLLAMIRNRLHGLTRRR